MCAHAEGVSTAAELILQQGSEPSEPCELGTPQAPAMGGVRWKGQQGVISDLIHLWVFWSAQPCQTVLGLLQGALAQVPSHPLTGKKAQETVHPYPGTPALRPLMHHAVAGACATLGACCVCIAQVLCGVITHSVAPETTTDVTLPDLPEWVITPRL